jgi:oxygen-independent coproporphyrinogen-3 oxidase
MTSTNLTALAARSLPRYTSYPTAPHFQALGAGGYGRWLRELPRGLEHSLYLHVPYCRSLCWYCGCHMRVENRYARLRPYVEAMKRELLLLGERLEGRPRLTHLHWGGGTPSILSGEDFFSVMRRVREVFEVTPGAELAIEIDPRQLSDDLLAALGESGITRASLGVQDFSPRVQEAIHREQSLELVAATVERLRGVGVKGINFDLMYGLPHQGEAEVRRSAELAAALQPDRLAVFGYAHVPWMKRHQRMIPQEALPGEAERLAQAEAASEMLTAAGYKAIGLDHFAKPEDDMALAWGEGRLSRNFQGYTTDKAEVLLPIGASAIGRLPQGFLQNEPDIARYIRRVEAGQLPVSRGLAISREERLRAAVIEKVMSAPEVDVGALCREWGFPDGALDESLEATRPLEAEGLLAREGRRLSIPQGARRFLRHIAAAFDAYLESGAARHSKAV